MRIIIFLCLLTLGCGCSELEPENNLTGMWETSWVYNEEELSGSLELRSDKTAILTVNGHPGSSLVRGNETHSYYWKKTQSFLEMTRMDNKFELDFTITSISQKSVRMLLADEIIIILDRK